MWPDKDSREERLIRIEAGLIGLFVLGSYGWLAAFVWRSVFR